MGKFNVGVGLNVRMYRIRDVLMLLLLLLLAGLSLSFVLFDLVLAHRILGIPISYLQTQYRTYLYSTTGNM